MAATTQTCPFCNAQFQITDPSGPRICPRCHEPLPGSAGNAPADAAAVPSPRSNRSVAGILGLVILGMAGIGLAYALWTVAFRRGNDSKEPTKVEVAAPAELRGLGYVPAGMNIVLGIHVAELMQTPEGRELVSRLRLPVGNIGLEGLEEWLGMPLSDVDHVVFAFQTEAIAFPPMLMFLQTRKPIDTGKMVEALKGGSAQTQGKKRYHLVRLPGRLGLECALWFASDNYQAIVNAPLGSVGGIPDQPHPGVDHLDPHIRQFLREQKRGTQVWLHGQVEDWEKTFLPLLAGFGLPGVSKKDLQMVMKLKELDITLQLDDGLRITTRVEGKDAAAAKDLAGFIQRIWAGVLGGDQEMQTFSQELEKNRKTTQKDAVITLETSASAEAVRAAFQPRPPEPEKKP